MKLLAVDTTSSRGGLALLNSKKVEALCQLELGKKHAERLIELIDYLLKLTGCTLNDLDGFAISIGPGSFTGLRIGVSTIKGFAFAIGKPVVAVPTLDAMAASCAYQSKLICPMINARRKEVYTALYRCSGALPERISEMVAEKPDKWLAKIAENQKDILFSGDGANLYADLIYEKLSNQAQILPLHLRDGFVSAVGSIGLRKLEQGQTEDLSSFEPLYLRAADAALPTKATFIKNISR